MKMLRDSLTLVLVALALRWTCVQSVFAAEPGKETALGVQAVKEARQKFEPHCHPIGEPFVSPGGIRWGKPLWGGPLDVLVILNERVARMSVELGQRMDVRSDTCFFDSYTGEFYAWDVAGKINARLAGDEKPYGVILLAEPLTGEPLAQAIKNSVNRGAGLVVIHDASAPPSAGLLKDILPPVKELALDEPEFMRQVPWRYLPSTRDGGPVLKCLGVGSHGQGRVVSLGYAGRFKGLMPDSFGLDESSSELDQWWEYVYSLVGKSALWCANRAMPANIEQVRFDADKGQVEVIITAREGFSGTLSLAWSDKRLADQSFKAKASVSVRGDEKVAVQLPIPEALRRCNGAHISNLFLADTEDKAVDWASGAFIVNGSITINESPPFTRDWFLKGQTIEGSVSILNRGAAPKQVTVTSELVDWFGRSVWSESRRIDISTGDASRVPVAPVLDRVVTNHHRLRVAVSDQRGVVDAREWVLRLPDQWQSTLDDFRFGGSANYYLGVHTDDVLAAYLRDVGVAFSSEGGPFEGAARLNMPWHFMYLGGPMLHNTERSSVRKNCFSNPQVIDQIVAYARNVYPKVRRNGALFCTLADEAELVKDGVVEMCFCPACAAGFREWTKRTYTSLDRTNAEWGTLLRSWDEVAPVTAEEVRKRGNFAQWIDFRTYMEDTVRNVLVAVQDGIKDPDALIGFSDPFGLNPFSGADHSKMAKTETAFAKYMRPDVLKECVSFNPTAPAHTYYGYGEGPTWCGWYPWWFAFNGGDLLVWWDPFGNGSPVLGLFDCFGRQTQRSVATLATVGDLQKGVGKILHEFAPARRRAAVLYSQASMHAAWAESGMRVGEAPWGDQGMYDWAETPPLHSFKLFYRSVDNCKALLKEAWFQPEFIAPEQILAGKLKDYQLLMLPYAGALSEDALSRVADFVKSGGTVLSDLRTGVYTEHGRYLASRPTFEQLFGVKRSEREFDPGSCSLSYSEAIASVPIGKGVDQAAGREALDLTSGQALARHADGTAAVIVNAYGKGKAIYLNFVPGGGPASTALMRQVLQPTGVRSEVTVMKGQDPAIGYECFLYERGPIQYLGLLRDLPPQPAAGRRSWHGHQFRHATTDKETVAVRLPRQSEVYDVRAGKHLGRVASVSLEFASTEAKILGLLPYRVTGVTIGGVKPQYHPGDKVRYQASVTVSKGTAGDHVLRIEVYNPDGEIVSCYSKNVLAVKGLFEDSLPLALNEKAGSWTLKVTDVTTSMSKSVRFQVSKRMADTQRR